jgi:hypothetical protein
MEARHALVLEDYVALNQHLQDQEDLKSGFSYTTYVVLTGVGCPLAAAWAAYRFATDGFRGALVGIGVAAVLGYMFVSILLTRSRSLRALRERLREETRDKVGLERVVRLTPAAFSETCAGRVHEVPWSAVKDVSAGRGCAYVFAEDVVFLIPERSLGGPEGLKEFEQTARRYWTEGKPQS